MAMHAAECFCEESQIAFCVIQMFKAWADSV